MSLLHFCPKSHAQFFLLYHLIYTCYAGFGARKCSFKVQVLLSLRVVFIYYTFCFTSYWTANCVSAEPWNDFSDKPFINGSEVHFYDAICNFRLILAFFDKKMPKTWASYLDSPHTNTLLNTHVFSFSEKHCGHMVSVM